MKKILTRLALCAATLIWFASCSTEKEFNTEFLYSGNGRWYSNNFIDGHDVYFVFNSDGSGKMWDITDDQQESEATQLQWSISGERYTYRRWIDISSSWGGASNDFTIIDLTASRFQYSNASGRTYLLQKQ